ncbi:hypothetical protein EQH89_04090 [Lacticaseibacillus paracasei]|uniref:hypothetical protein n=1 Tax=Lacticaseibacillus paracasei TaxID=1597 RepID=UPI000FF4591D|nr:hypothetical protein [Lacticaseibacillus paracasei]RWZ62326.1 hypothetical protein EQH89_04090 [Lacticaseibacillus paracasei]
MTVTLDVKGLEDLENKLSQKFSDRKVALYVNNALTIAGRYAVAELKQAAESYRDTGATVNEITAGKPRLRGGVRNIKIGWSGDGSKQRWRLVHLNEFGYTRNGRTYAPRGIGKIRSSYDEMQPKLKELEAAELRKLL